MRARVGLVGPVLALAFGLVVGPPGLPPAAAAPGCPALPGVTTYRWTGGAGNGRFGDRRNWRPRQVPGIATDTPTDYVCIPAGVDVTIGSGEEADLQAIASRGALHLDPGSKLFVGSRTGAAAAPASTVADLDVVGATLGGTAALTVTGILNWTSVPPDAGATQTTRALEDIAGGPPAFTGRTVIAPGATMTIAGGTSADGGVNLRDDRGIDVFGSAVIDNGGFLAADWGTSLRLLRSAPNATGTLTFHNDGGIYQGFIGTDLPWETSRATVVNGGVIVKEPGAAPGSSEGTSVIDAVYVGDDGAGHAGSIDVRSGTITIFGTDAAAALQPGGTIGFGGCADGVAVCAAPTTDASNPQLATFGAVGRPAAVGVSLGAPIATNPYHRALVGDPVVVTLHPRATPSLLTLRIDHSLLGTDTLAQMAVGLGREILPSCDVSVAPCLLAKAHAADDSGDFVLTVSTAHGGAFRPLGPRFR